MKTGIVLEGGALRTIFSSGACDGLLEAGLLPDYVIGVSAGIAYGVSYVSRQFGRNLEILTKYANDKRYMGKRNLLRPANRCYFGLKFTYEDIPNIQELVRQLRHKGAFSNTSCGIHIHVEAAPFNARTLRNLVNLFYSKEDLLFSALKVNPSRWGYCKPMDERFLPPALEGGRHARRVALMDAIEG